MHESIFATLLRSTYTISDLAYKIGLLKEFLEHVFFKAHVSKITKEVVINYCNEQQKPDTDSKILLELSESFLNSFTKDNFYDTLTEFEKKADTLPTLHLTLPIEMSKEYLSNIGDWARKELEENTMLDIEVDPMISVGCRVAWNNKMHDLSFSYFLQKSEKELSASIGKMMEAKS